MTNRALCGNLKARQGLALRLSGAEDGTLPPAHILRMWNLLRIRAQSDPHGASHQTGSGIHVPGSAFAFARCAGAVPVPAFGMAHVLRAMAGRLLGRFARREDDLEHLLCRLATSMQFSGLFYFLDWRGKKIEAKKEEGPAGFGHTLPELRRHDDPAQRRRDLPG